MPRVLQIIMMALSGTAVTGAVHYYLYRRLVKHTQIGSPWRQIAKWTIFALFLGIFLSFIVRRYLPFEIGRVVMFVPYIWMGSITFIFLILLVSDLMKLLLSGIRKVGGGKPTDPERRIFFARMAAAISAVTAVGFGAFAVPNALRKAQVKLVEVKLARLPKVLSGFTIVQITDLHIGINLGRAWAEQVVQQVNALKPDLIAITGDLVDGSPDRLRHEVEPLADLKAPNGVFFVTGNHEYYSGITEWIPEFEGLGMRVLRNERISVGLGKATFDLAGIDDSAARDRLKVPGHGPDLKKAVKDRDPQKELVLLAHQPREVFEAAEHNVGLLLSGHTHGGQFWPYTYFVYMSQPYRSGLHRHTDNTQVYVSEGTGYWGPPMRLGTQGEITLVKLLSGQDNIDTV